MPEDEAPLRIRGASKDYSARGSCREHWYRMVLRCGEWRYFSDGRLPAGNYLASDRQATTKGDVWIGELIVQHDRGGPINRAYLVTGGDENIVTCPVAARRGGGLSITLPDGTVVATPSARS
jgi:hypothetical protein